MPHLDAAHRFACWLTRRQGDAEDIVQEAFLRAFRHFDKLRGDDAKAWLLAIVRNCYASALKDRLRRAAEPLPAADELVLPAETPDEAPGPEQASIGADEQRLLERLIATLPEEHREVLVLRELEDMSYREIAAVTAVPIGTVMSRLARARSALREKYLQAVPGEGHAVR